LILAGGCFWCLEHDLESLKGINFVQSGYSGGDLQNPIYENHEGHQEVVLVNYDSQLVSLPEILRLYFRNIDPLDGKGQFCDRGDSYRPVIFFKDATEENDAKNNGADLVGSDDLIETISKSKIEFDVLIATPDMMPKLGKVAKILGPKGLMPNPKLGTVTNEISQSVKDAKSGQVKFKNDKSGIVHAGVGKLDFSEEDLLENIKTFFSSVSKSKPDAVKGSFIKKVTIASTMGVGLNINQASLR